MDQLLASASGSTAKSELPGRWAARNGRANSSRYLASNTPPQADRFLLISVASSGGIVGPLMYKKVLLAYDGSIEGRRALREGAKLAQFCGAEVFLPAVVETASSVSPLEGGVMISMEDQYAIYEAILAEGVERLKAMGFSPTARLGMGAPGPEIAGVAEEIGANLVVVGHRPSGPLARWLFGSVGTYLVKRLRCSVLVAQTEINDDQFAKLMATAGLAT